MAPLMFWGVLKNHPPIIPPNQLPKIMDMGTNKTLIPIFRSC